MSDKEIYFTSGNEQYGPYTAEEFARLGIPGDTLIWYAGLNSWIPAAEAPLTSGLYDTGNHRDSDMENAETERTQIVRNDRKDEPIEVEVMDDFDDDDFDNDSNLNDYPQPATHLAWAIVTTLMCFLPFGVISLIYANRVNTLWDEGKYEDAILYSKRANIWGWWAFGFGILCYIIGIIIMIKPFLNLN